MATRNKAAQARAIYPVESLRAQVTALEEAIAQVLAKPKKKAVHALRKATRKIEAQFQVMAVLGHQEPGFRDAAKPAKRVSKVLKQLRRSAGTVRDLDVQRELAKETLAHAATKDVREEAKELRRELKLKRGVEAEALVHTLRHHALELEPALERLLQSLEPVAEVGLSKVDLEVLTRDWFAKRRRRAEREKRTDEQMHGVRKAAKLARYMAEDGATERVVKEFETLQETGGRWHDALTLRDVARERLGRKSSLAAVLSTHEIEAREEFRQRMAAE